MSLPLPKSASPLPKSALRTPKPQKNHALASQLRTLAQTLAPGDRMPSVPELVRDHAVAKTTAETAVQTLEQEGLVVRRRGSGTFVAPRMAVPPRPSGDKRDVRNQTVGVFALFTNAYFQTAVAHLIAEAASVGLDVECRYSDHHLTLDDVLRFERMDAPPVGFVVVGRELSWVGTALAERGYAAVLMGEPNDAPETGVPQVYADAEQGGYVATRYLLELGHRRIGFLHPFFGDEHEGKNRWQGHVRALREAGISGPPRVLGMDIMRQMWRGLPAPDVNRIRAQFTGKDAPTAVAAWSDPYGAELLTALHAAGLRVPHDVSVIGYDNLPQGQNASPALTTVDQCLDMQARHIFSLLSVFRTGRNPNGALVTPPISRSLITPTLVVRASCAAPPLRVGS